MVFGGNQDLCKTPVYLKKIYFKIMFSRLIINETVAETCIQQGHSITLFLLKGALIQAELLVWQKVLIQTFTVIILI